MSVIDWYGRGKLCSVFIRFFFFQAEDGIRDRDVTGVQTCALPIFGVWLFYVQHQFEPTYWEHDERWAYDAAALQGSSYYRLPKLLQWATGNIGLHHIHHLHPRIPNYRLQQALDDHAELRQVPTLTLWESLRCVRLTLWDERARKLVPFAAVSEVGT